MINSWTVFKRFPDPQHGEYVEAPIGPGVYEVRNILTGKLVAFGFTANVAAALVALLPKSSPMAQLVRFIRQDIRCAVKDLEYRTRATKTLREAVVIAGGLNGRRIAYTKIRQIVSLE